MRCNVILVIIAIVAVAAIAGISELRRWIQNRRYSSRVRFETARYGKSR